MVGARHVRHRQLQRVAELARPREARRRRVDVDRRVIAGESCAPMTSLMPRLAADERAVRCSGCRPAGPLGGEHGRDRAAWRWPGRALRPDRRSPRATASPARSCMTAAAAPVTLKCATGTVGDFEIAGARSRLKSCVHSVSTPVADGRRIARRRRRDRRVEQDLAGGVFRVEPASTVDTAFDHARVSSRPPWPPTRTSGICVPSLVGQAQPEEPSRRAR